MIYIKNTSVKRILKVILPWVLIPAASVLGVLFLRDSYIAVSLFVTILTLVLFLSGIEKKKLTTRRLVLTAALTAISVIGRFIPVFKPVTAMTAIGGIFLGAEAGFTVGAISALISNFYFGQGPWTPFQMLSWGMIGLLSGIFSRFLSRSRLLLYIFAVLSGVVFSLIMDFWNVLFYSGEEISLSLYGAAVITSLPHMATYAVSNVIFIAVLYGLIGKKLDRIKKKYGI